MYINEIKEIYDTQEKKQETKYLSKEWSTLTHCNKAVDFFKIKQTVINLLKVHGIPEDTEISFAKMNSSAKALAGFKSIEEGRTHFTGPFMLIDGNIYYTHEKEDILDMYCALALHEASHLNHSRHIYHRLQKGVPLPRAMWEGLLEDERIEQKVREESPGFSVYLHKLKKVLFEGEEFGRKWKGFSELPDLDKANAIIFAYIRVPYLLEDVHKQWKTVGDICVFEELEKMIVGIPRSELEVERLGQKLEKLWLRIKLDYDEPEPPKSEESEGESGGGESGESSKTEGAPGGTSEKDRLERLRKQHEASKLDASDRHLRDRVKDDPSSLFKPPEIRKGRFSVEDTHRMLKRHFNVREPVNSEIHKEVESLERKEREYTELWNYEGIKRESIILYKHTECRDRYTKAKESVRAFISKMRTVFNLRLAKKVINRTELLEGRLHGRNLYKFKAGNKRLFHTRSTKTSKGFALCLLLDESGSMYGTKATSAFECAVMIAESLKNISGVELEVYSYTSEGLSEKDSRVKYLYGKKNKNIYGISAYWAKANNYDHMALQVAGDLFIENTDNVERIMLVMSDGHPAGHCYGGGPAIALTREAVKKLETKGIKVINVAIENYSSEKIYDRVIKFLNHETLVEDMRKLITGIFKKMTQS